MVDGSTTQQGAERFAVRAPRRRPGRFGLMAGTVVIGLVLLASAAIWRLRSVSGIPDVGDPFDVAAARRSIDLPDEDNAYALYAEARGKFTRVPASMAKVELAGLAWSKAGEAVRDYLEQNRAAMDLWRRGSERPDALYHQPGELEIDTLLPLVQDMGMLAVLGGLEGSRLEEQGQMEAAWGWYRAMLRHSRLVGRHGLLIERLVGGAHHKAAADRILHWAADPRVDAPLLRRALADTIAADALTPPLSEALKLEYLIYMRDLRELRAMPREIALPGGASGLLEQMAASAGLKGPIERFWLRASNDDERSRRLLRMIFANWLAQVDRPATRRAPIAVRPPVPIGAPDPEQPQAARAVVRGTSPVPIYADDPTAPPAARALDPAELAKRIGQSVLSSHILQSYPYVSLSSTLWEDRGPLARERTRRSALIVRLAAELYRREKGQPPATAGALIGPYLDELPEGIGASDPIPEVKD